MSLKNLPQGYGWVSILIHWSMALGLLALYIIGDYMVGLNYYDKLYHTLPNFHKAAGILLGILLLVRIGWMFSHPRPLPARSTAPEITHLFAKLGHLALYGLIILMLVSGYLISTAKGHDIAVFGWFDVPALLPENADRGELAGKLHEWLGLAFILLVVIHALAAFVHHFYWQDNTLTRMLGKKPKETTS